MTIQKYFFVFFILSIGMQACYFSSSKEGITVGEQINGVSFVASRDSVAQPDIDQLLEINTTWVSIMPYAFAPNHKGDLYYNNQRQWWGESQAGVAHTISLIHANGLKVMLKPQVWMRNGAYTGKFTTSSESEWELFEANYRNYILEFANLADSMKVELFCIGTEWEAFIQQRPAYWSGLIKEIRTIYKGQLTYAANWDEFTGTPFWDQLDFIGIDAYFPLSDLEEPEMVELVKAWSPHIKRIEKFSTVLNKPVLFTEYGYRSIPYTAKEPWNASKSEAISLQAQVTAYEALYASAWNKPWMAGGFVWKWYHHHYKSGGESDSGFTPQNKPVEGVIRDQYFKNN